MIEAALISKIKTLSPGDRLELIGAVWESLTPEDAPATTEERQLLDARKADLLQNPHDQSPWREVQVRLKQRLS